jgi:signal transduction histidine kinase/ActR/RegA family two-component response regulator
MMYRMFSDARGSAFSTPPADASTSCDEQRAVASQVRDAQVRAMHEVMPLAQCASLVCGFGVAAMLWHRIELAALLPWLLARVSVSLVRIWYSLFCLRDLTRHTDRHYVTMALLDGIVWGALGWWLTPFMDLNVAVVTLSMGIAAASIGVIMLHIHATANSLFVVPVLVPNAFYALQRGDDLGLFCCVGFLGLTALLLFEGTRLNRRSLDNLRLRFESEQAHQAERRALQKLKELADMRSRFVATVSHEMRTPLHGMLGLLRLVQEQADRPPDPRHLTLMHHSGQHLINVINDVLDFTKLESSGLPIAPKPFSLSAFLQDLTDTVRLNCETKGLTLALVSDLPSNTWVLGDETRIRQVLLNLLGNAIKFTSRGGIVLTASHAPETGHTLLAVKDSGVGIPSADLQRIFEPYQQAEGTYERRFGGSGLGLTISLELCRAMGGSLRCDSLLGAGSTFTCELPLRRAEPQAPPCPVQVPEAMVPTSAPKPCPASARRHVLLVDDNPVNTIVAEAELQALGLDVTSAASAQEALDWLVDNQPDIVLMDCEMPVMDGVAATQEIRRREQRAGRPPVPIIALTANGRDAYEGRCHPAGMNDYLGKPFERAELRDVVARHLAIDPQRQPCAPQLA